MASASSPRLPNKAAKVTIVGVDELGWHAPYELVHHLEEAAHGVAGVGGFLGWLAGTGASALVGLLVGAVVVVVVHQVHRVRGHRGVH